VLYESLIAFQKIGDRSVAPQLEFLLRDLDEKVQLAAVETAGLLYNMEALPSLRSVLERTQKQPVRRATLAAIAMLPDRRTGRFCSPTCQTVTPSCGQLRRKAWAA